MSQSVVRTFQMSRSVSWLDEADKFQFDPKGKAPWLQRLCFWVLARLGAHAKFAAEHIKRVDIDLNKLVDALMRNRADVEMLFNKRAKYLVVGADKFRELATSEATAPYMTFQIPREFHARAGYNGRPMPQMFAGLQVVVVPWIDGMFVLPELEG